MGNGTADASSSSQPQADTELSSSSGQQQQQQQQHLASSASQQQQAAAAPKRRPRLSAHLQPTEGPPPITFAECQAAAVARGLCITRSTLGPFYRIICRQGEGR